MSHSNHQIARNFVEALFTGDLPDDLFTPNMTAWTTLGSMDRVAYQAAVKAVISLFAAPGFVNPTIEAITAEDNRAVVEAHSKGSFPDGDAYEQTYVWILRLRDGRIESLAEHFNPLSVIEKMFPRMEQSKVPA
jgi:ketosteroid isomerase-like protein